MNCDVGTFCACIIQGKHSFNLTMLLSTQTQPRKWHNQDLWSKEVTRIPTSLITGRTCASLELVRTGLTRVSLCVVGGTMEVPTSRVFRFTTCLLRL